MSTLEARYRRLLTLLPAAYREQRAEEMLGTLLDGAVPGRRRPRLAEALSVARLAVRLRVGAPGGSVRAAGAGEVLRRLALVALLVQALYYTTVLVGLVAAWSSGSDGHPIGSLLPGILVLADPVLPGAAFVCVVRGGHRAGRLLAVLGTATLCVGAGETLASAGFVASVFPSQILVRIFVSLLMSLMGTGALLLGFHRDAPAVTSPGRWLALGAASLGLVLATAGTGDYLGAHGDWSNPLARIDIRFLITSPLGPVLVALFAVTRARRSAIWPASLLLLGLPALALLSAPGVVLFDHMAAAQAFGGEPFPGAHWPQLIWEVVLTEAVLAGSLWWAMRRGRRTGAGLAPADAGRSAGPA